MEKRESAMFVEMMTIRAQIPFVKRGLDWLANLSEFHLATTRPLHGRRASNIAEYAPLSPSCKAGLLLGCRAQLGVFFWQ